MRTAIAVVLGAALIGGALAVPEADAALRKKKARIPSQAAPSTKAIQPPLDRFMACDVRIREYLRDGGTAIRVKKIEVDDARLQLNIHHEYGEAGKSNRRFLRGDSEEEMRRTLHGILEEFRAAADAAATGRAWYLIVPRTAMPMPDSRAGSAESTSPWVAVVLADIQGKCRPVAFYQSVDREKLDPELSKRLEE